MALWTVKELVKFVRGHHARGRDRFGFVAENGDMFNVWPAEDGNGVRVAQEGGVFGIQLCEWDPLEDLGDEEAWGGDPGDEWEA
tara:strand:- start:1779 stop:2030 length:252 start_codon:yes stop_codon:yes gene_type:complete